jgi:hypothetical protein
MFKKNHKLCVKQKLNHVSILDFTTQEMGEEFQGDLVEGVMVQCTKSFLGRLCDLPELGRRRGVTVQYCTHLFQIEDALEKFGIISCCYFL